MTKKFWLLEIGDLGTKPLYVAHFKEGVAFTTDMNQACKFALEKYAKNHLINLKAMYPAIEALGHVFIAEHGFDWSQQQAARA